MPDDDDSRLLPADTEAGARDEATRRRWEYDKAGEVRIWSTSRRRRLSAASHAAYRSSCSVVAW